ncbi:Prephenate dehydratase [Cynara cardunculus var. scolymus]|uniref:Prephenate dehydratase n=1 Tax=Cynara cardunculus var. scolymus TaxID=59895 RepID=A0A118K4R2_CYNCS|nr:Prephenate dehydratase [Cynara cardunculus var. scolymus]
MAASIRRTPISLPHNPIRSTSNPKLPSNAKFPLNVRRCSTSVSASSSSIQGGTNEGKSSSLPRPLSSTDLTGLPPEGSRLRVAYQGVGGAYSESAAEKAYPNCEAVPCEQFETAFEAKALLIDSKSKKLGQSSAHRFQVQKASTARGFFSIPQFHGFSTGAVERWLVDRAVLPIENSLGGSIHRNYDLLLRHRLHIVGEVKLAIRHCLLANHCVKVEDLKRVLSHPQALAQCENTLTKLGIVREAVDDTAGAAKVALVFAYIMITKNDNEHVALHKLKDTGAVASAAAAKIYGLNLLVQDIQDYSDNVTRFLMLAREPIIPRTDRPFKIESRPLQRQALPAHNESTSGFPGSFPYLFYVDFQASMADQRAQNALSHLKEFATFLSVLGSYPEDISI